MAGVSESSPASVEAGPGERRRSPAFIPAPPAIQNDPTKRGYDLNKVLAANDNQMNEVFAAEPVDPAWAPIFEKRVAGAAEKDFRSTGVNARVTDVTCKSTVCLATIEADSKTSLAAADALFQVFSVADQMAMGGRVDGKEFARRYYLGFSGEWHDPDANQKLASSYRKWKLTQLRKRAEKTGATPDYPVPAE